MLARHRTVALALIAVVIFGASPAVYPAQPAFPFTIVGSEFHFNGRRVFLQMLSYQPLEPGQAPELGDTAIRQSRITDDLRRFRAFRGGSDPIVLRLYEQPTSQQPQRFPTAFYDGLRELGFWVLRDIYFDPDFTAPDAITRGRAAIDRVIAEVEAAGAFDRIFAWEFGNEFAAEGANVATLENFLTTMRNHVKARMAEPGRDAFSNWVTWASWPASDPLRTIRPGSPIHVPSLDYVSFNAYSYDPERMRDHQGGHATGTPFAGYLTALKARFPGKPVVLTETGLPDSVSAVGENQARLPPLYPNYRRGALTPAQVAEGITDRYWDARLSGAVAGFQIFQWADGWYKTGNPAEHSTDPEESFGLCRFVTSPAIQLRCKLQLWTIQTLYTMRFPAATPVVSGLTADATLLMPNGSTTVRVQLSANASPPIRFRWEASRGRIVGDGDVVTFHAGGTALGPALITVVAIDAEGNATTASTTIEIQPGAPTVELLTFGSQRSSGRVANVDLTQYKVVLYVRTNQFYVQPFTDMKSIWVSNTGFFWSSNFVGSQSASLHAWLVPNSYDPPDTMTTAPAAAIAGSTLNAMNDADSDLLPDAIESNAPNEDRYSDPDNDGATHLDEFLRGSDLHAPDNDADSDALADDWEEHFFGTLAYTANQDPDGDGLTNASERSAGTHPGRTDVDRDRDGLPDAFELRRFGTLSQGPLDTNSGGIRHLDAYQLGIVSPTISDITNQTTTRGVAVGPLPFTIADDDNELTDLVLSATSSNATLLPVTNIVFGGSGGYRTVTLTPTPNQQGVTNVTLLVNDGEGGAATESFTLTVTDPTGNLRITTLSTSSVGAGGEPLSIATATKNDGTVPVSATHTGIWLSSDKILGGDILLASVPTSSLAAGAKQQVVSNVSLPSIAPGEYYVIAQADMGAAATETNEADNFRTRSLIIGPDLAISMTLSPSSPTSSTPTTISVTTKNVGGDIAQASKTRLYRSLNGKVDATSILLREFDASALAPGAESTGIFIATLPAGTYSLIAIVDATGIVQEARETNNLKKVKKTVP